MKACVGVRKKKMCSLTNADLVIVNPRDMILKITSAAICGSDLHLLQWFDAHNGKGRRPVMSRCRSRSDESVWPVCSPIRICWTHSRRISPEGSRQTFLHATWPTELNI